MSAANAALGFTGAGDEGAAGAVAGVPTVDRRSTTRRYASAAAIGMGCV